MRFQILLTATITLILTMTKGVIGAKPALTTYSEKGCDGKYQIYDFKESIDKGVCQNAIHVSLPLISGGIPHAMISVNDGADTMRLL